MGENEVSTTREIAPVTNPDSSNPHPSASLPTNTDHCTGRDRIQPGDIITFSGIDLPSTVVKVATHSNYVHVAIVFSIESSLPSSLQLSHPNHNSLRDFSLEQHNINDRGNPSRPHDSPSVVPSVLKKNKPETILIAESHIDTSQPSVGTGKRTLGVQLQWLSDRLFCAKGPVWWAPLRIPLTSEQIYTLQTWLWTVEAQGTPYDFVQAIGAGLDACDRIGLENTPDESAFFCSELVTCALQRVGVVSDRINPSEQTPADLMTFSCFHPPVLLQDPSLGDRNKNH